MIVHPVRRADAHVRADLAQRRRVAAIVDRLADVVAAPAAGDRSGPALVVYPTERLVRCQKYATGNVRTERFCGVFGDSRRIGGPGARPRGRSPTGAPGNFACPCDHVSAPAPHIRTPRAVASPGRMRKKVPFARRALPRRRLAHPQQRRGTRADPSPPRTCPRRGPPGHRRRGGAAPRPGAGAPRDRPAERPAADGRLRGGAPLAARPDRRRPPRGRARPRAADGAALGHRRAPRRERGRARRPALALLRPPAPAREGAAASATCSSARRPTSTARAGVRIVDWRHAPVSQIYYRYEEGAEYEETFGERDVEGKVLRAPHRDHRRRRAAAASRPRRAPSCRATHGWRAVAQQATELAGGQGTAVRPASATAGRPGAARDGALGVGATFAAREDRHLPEIAALLDPRQFELISRPDSGIVVIQGGAGSGKTTIGIHRMAFLNFNARHRFAADKMLDHRRQPGAPRVHRRDPARARPLRRGRRDVPRVGERGARSAPSPGSRPRSRRARPASSPATRRTR